MKQRLRTRDLSLNPLTFEADKLRAKHSKSDQRTGELVKDFLEHALAAPYKIDFLFWAKATTDAFAALPKTRRAALHKTMIRRVTAASKVDPDRRSDLIDRLTAVVVLSTVANAA